MPNGAYPDGIVGSMNPPGTVAGANAGLNTMPVGAPGTDTTSPSFAPVLPLYNVDFPVPLSATHHGLVALAVSPQGLTRSGSVRSAETAPSETRLCCL